MAIAKWLLAGVGWAIGGPIGAIIGYLVGRTFSSSGSDNAGGNIGDGQSGYHRPYQNTGSENDINLALLVLIAAVMKADGEVKHSELNYVKRFLISNYGEDKSKDLLLALRDIVKKDIAVGSVCQQIKVNTDYTTRYHMVDFLCGLAEADGSFDYSEQRVIRSIVSGLGINASDYASIYARHSTTRSYSHSYRRASSNPETLADPYAVLGLTSSATNEEIKKAYRRLAMKYHPDRVESMGDEIKRNAEEQFKKINDAYQTICTARDIK